MQSPVAESQPPMAENEVKRPFELSQKLLGGATHRGSSRLTTHSSPPSHAALLKQISGDSQGVPAGTRSYWHKPPTLGTVGCQAWPVTTEAMIRHEALGASSSATMQPIRANVRSVAIDSLASTGSAYPVATELG